MSIPKGFIKESGVYRRDTYIFDGKQIIKESTLIPTEDAQDELIENSFETLSDATREALQYSSDIGQELRTKDIYIDKVKENQFKISEKQSKNTVAIVTPDNNVYELKFTEIPEQTDKSLAPDKDEAKAPKEEKEIKVKPEEIKEGEDTKWSVRIIVNGEQAYYSHLVAKDIDEILDKAKSLAPNIEYESQEIKEATYDEDFEKEENLPVDEPTGEAISEEPVEEVTEDIEVEEEPESNVQPMDSAYFIRRPQNITDLQDKIDRHLVNLATYQIVDEIELSQEEFDNYAENLRQDAKFLKTFRPSQTNADFTCIAVKSPEGKTLLIDNSGYDSAQYVSII